MKDPENKSLSVSAAIRLVKQELDQLALCIEGEVSQVSNKPGYKAVYFTIKDEHAALPCLMWMNRYARAGVELKVGSVVRVTGKFSIYAAKGTMNFEVASLVMAGEGDIRLKIARLARKLADEGLTAPERKRRIPVLPETIGLVTSPRGAAVHDVLRTLRRRYPFARVLLAGVPVEGAQAPHNIISGIKAVVAAGAQLVLVVRGGGSFEDLLPFNDEALARTIAACPVPVVTGIGHEPDTTLADLVADLRCSTPTAAAEAVSPEDGALEGFLEQSWAKMRQQLQRQINFESVRLDAWAKRPLFKDPQALFAQAWMGLDYCSDRLARALPSNVQRDAARLDHAARSLRKAGESAFRDERARLELSAQRAGDAMKQALDRNSSCLALAAAKVDSLSPLGVLSRGYSIALKSDGAVVKSASSVDAGESFDLRLFDGVLSCTVDAVKEIR